MPIAATVPVAQPSLARFVIVSVATTLEPAVVSLIYYAPCDAQGTPTGPVAVVTMTPAAHGAFASQPGGMRAKFYSALQNLVPALAGTVT